MKTKIEIEIETSDYYELHNDNGIICSEQENKEFTQDWHETIVKFILNLKEHIDKNYIPYFEEFWNEDGEFPKYSIITKKLQ